MPMSDEYGTIGAGCNRLRGSWKDAPPVPATVGLAKSLMTVDKDRH